jgi:hypothetical protein
MVAITHAFVSGKTDGTDATLVQPSNWNAALNHSMQTARVLGRATAGTGSIEELAVTGTGSVVLSISPTFTGTLTAAAVTAYGAFAQGGTYATLGDFNAGTTYPAVGGHIAIGWNKSNGNREVALINSDNVATGANYGGFRFYHQTGVSALTTLMTIDLLGNAAITGTTASTSTTTGALTVAGGLGVSGAIYSAGLINSAGNISVNASNTISLNGPNGNCYIVYSGGNILIVKNGSIVATY